MTNIPDIPSAPALPTRPPTLADRLVAALNPLLDHTPDTDTVAALEEQALMLDIAFRRLLSEADGRYLESGRPYCIPSRYIMALRAQNQYRCTVKALADLRKRDERTEGSG